MFFVIFHDTHQRFSHGFPTPEYYNYSKDIITYITYCFTIDKSTQGTEFSFLKRKRKREWGEGISHKNKSNPKNKYINK